ncbi:universal stress protein [Candidatus Nitrosotenuis aquarius]|jgi:nucleotide-binding universal stress UspA family protein|uniref:universal stress protein n=1 Tax=Candidatus Nitrosotenuis aquarius TaxID=1846278 RepID=UPI000C1EA0F7|nr:universal stress protein [Candidatus Nitrosotenuis aquarius]
MFAKILVCIDGSKYSLKAVKIACELAKKHNSTLSIIYVVDKTAKSSVLAGSEYTKILRKYAQEALEKAYQTALLHGVQPNVVTKEGNVANEIIQYSKTTRADLIVVGSKGLGAVLRFVLGSISSKIAQHSLCSVLIVK